VTFYKAGALLPRLVTSINLIWHLSSTFITPYTAQILPRPTQIYTTGGCYTIVPT